MVRGFAERSASRSFDDSSDTHRIVRKREHGRGATSLTSYARCAQQRRRVLEIGRYFSLLVATRLFAGIEDGAFVVLVVVVVVLTTRGASGFGSLYLGELGFKGALFLWGRHGCGLGLLLLLFCRGFIPVALCGVSGVCDGIEKWHTAGADSSPSSPSHLFLTGAFTAGARADAGGLSSSVRVGVVSYVVWTRQTRTPVGHGVCAAKTRLSRVLCAVPFLAMSQRCVYHCIPEEKRR